ncbi:MAG TPA: cytochrome c biogenesis protein DipZ [Mycobacteriales bacterium]|nr:cytochrome c biogenesis protein DipZ [Mycobacteriales bacterium]
MNPLLLAIGFVAGLLTIVSPCILPVLPAVIASGVTTGGRRRALAVATGLALAFGLAALFSIRVLDALHLSLNLRRDVAEVALFALALGLFFPIIGQWLERPFARLGFNRSPDAARSGLVLGAMLGLLYLPCGGPILSAISAVGQTNSMIGAPVVGLTLAYSLGIAAPIFALVLITSRLTTTTTWLRTHALAVRRSGAVLLAASAAAISLGAAMSLQSDTPSFASAIERHLTSNSSVSSDLAHISNPHESRNAQKIHRSLSSKPAASSASHPAAQADAIPALKASALPDFGKAPNFTDATRWFNTPDGAPINISQLRGKVVLIDFWTYSCINCLRSLPHVKAWYARYHSAGLDVIGVHTPEFDFEHVPANVQAAIHRLGITYPVVMDNDYGTWDAWGNNSWPAEYLVDAQGNVRYGSIGESDYGTTEAAIRALLNENGAKLPPSTDVPDRTPTERTTPESYLGYERLARYVGTPIVKNRPATYSFASSLPRNGLSYSGVWTVRNLEIAAGAGAALRINVSADDVYLVLSGNGTVTGTFNAKPISEIHVSGVPELYPVLSGSSLHGVLQLDVPSGITAYDFTFG